MKSIEQIAAELQGYDPKALPAEQVNEFLSRLVTPIAETEAPAQAEPKPRRGRRKKAEAAAEPAVAEEAQATEPVPEAAEAAEAEPKPKRRTRKKAAETAEQPAEPAQLPAADNDPNGGEPGEGPRRGWWQRTFG